VDAMLSEENLKKTGLFDSQKVTRLLNKYRSGGHGSEVQNMAVVGILSAQLIHHQFIEKFPSKPGASFAVDKLIQKNADHR
jgi:asparagine synthase (glutamine-hydrolysing)